MKEKKKSIDKQNSKADPQKAEKPSPKRDEVGGPPGPEPTRYGDWELGGKCVDF